MAFTYLSRSVVQSTPTTSFHVVKNLFRHRKAHYRWLTKNTAQLFSLFALANLVLASRLLPPPGHCVLRTPKGPGKPGRRPERGAK
jgi:IS5 family transposase